MSDAPKPAAPVQRTTGTTTNRVGSFLGWAFVISLVLHAVTLPFFGLKAQSHEKTETEKVSVTKKIRVTPPTPPPPTPTPPPPTPPPKSTPPPVKQTNPPPQPKLKLNVVKTTSKTGPSENRYVAPPVGNENGNPQGTEASGPPAAPAPVAATPAPTPAPPTATPKPTCPNPNAAAGIKGVAVQPDFPDIAKEQGAAGTTNVKVTLDAEGNAVEVSIYKSSGNVILDQSALKAARATAYTPELVNCVKTAGSYLFTADFDSQ